MEHSVKVEAYGVRLRPVRMADAEFIVKLRSSPHAEGFIGDSAADVGSQEAWLRAYFERPDDLYFIIERGRDGQAVGTSGICDIQGTVGEWARWVIMPGVEAAPGSMWLTFHTAFDVLGLEILRALVVDSNTRMLSIHKKAGSTCLGISLVRRVIGGKSVNLVEFRIAKADWPRISAAIERYARIAERIL